MNFQIDEGEDVFRCVCGFLRKRSEVFNDGVDGMRCHECPDRERVDPPGRTCPYCDYVVPAGLERAESVRAEFDHMRLRHRNVIERRLTESGFRRDPHTGEWVDTLADPEGR